MSKAISGDVTITLDGEERTLQPTLDAMIRVPRYFGGYQKAHERVFTEKDLDAVAVVVRLGLGEPEKKATEILEKVARTGVLNLFVTVGLFVGILANGGRPLAGGEEDEEKALEGND